jgi:hypothetical protein
MQKLIFHLLFFLLSLILICVELYFVRNMKKGRKQSIKERNGPRKKLVSSYSLSKWLKTHGSLSLNYWNSSNVFVDDHNEIRDSSWSATGIQLNPINTEGDIEIQGDFQNQKEIVMASKRNNYKFFNQSGYICVQMKIYAHLSSVNNPHDEIMIESPYFKVCMDLIFHYRTAQVAYLVFGWSLIVVVILSNQYLSRDHRGIEAYTVVSTFSLFIMVGVYLCAYYVNKGVLPPCCCLCRSNCSSCSCIKQKTQDSNVIDNLPTSNTKGKITVTDHQRTLEAHTLALQNLEKEQQLPQSKQPLFISRPCTRLLYIVWKKTWEEIRSVTQEYHDILTIPNLVQQQLNYLTWLNMSLKLLKKLNGRNASNARLDRKTYRQMLLVTMILFPIYVVISFYVDLVLLEKGFCGSGEAHSSVNCKEVNSIWIFSFGGLTQIVIQTFYSVGVF